jgi:hypothetical protein
MKKLLLLGMLLCSPFVLADAGVVVDAGSVDVVLDADAGVVAFNASGPFERDSGVADVGDAGVADAGVKLVSGDDIDIVGIAKKARESGHSKNWSVMFIIVSVLVVLTWGVRKFGGMFIPFLKTDRGGAITVLVLGFLGGILNVLATRDSLSIDVVIEGFVFSIMSAGGFSVVKKLLFPAEPADSGAKKV